MFRGLNFKLKILKMSPLIIAKVATNNLSNLMSQKQICRQIIYGMIYGTFFGSIVRNFNLNLCMLAQNYSIYTLLLHQHELSRLK